MIVYQVYLVVIYMVVEVQIIMVEVVKMVVLVVVVMDIGMIENNIVYCASLLNFYSVKVQYFSHGFVL